MTLFVNCLSILNMITNFDVFSVIITFIDDIITDMFWYFNNMKLLKLYDFNKIINLTICYYMLLNSNT